MKIKIVNGLAVLSHGINIVIFLYFAIILIKIDILSARGLFISAFGIFMSLIANIISALDNR